MTNRQSRAANALILLALSACGSQQITSVVRDGAPLIQTDRLEYALEPSNHGLQVDIPYVFTNRTDSAVYLVNCSGLFALRLERLEAGEWKFAWGPVLPECLSPPIVIQPGERFEATLRVWGARPGDNVVPQFDVPDPSGVYRIVWIDALSSFQDDLPFGEQIPLEYRISNRFVLQR